MSNLAPRPWFKDSLRIIKFSLAVLPFLLLIHLLNHRYVFLYDSVASFIPGRPVRQFSLRAGTVVQSMEVRGSEWRLMTDHFPFRVSYGRAVDSIRLRMRLRAQNVSRLSLSVTGAKYRDDISKLIYSAVLNGLDWNYSYSRGLSLWQRPERLTDAKLNPNDPTKTVPETKPVRQFGSLDDLALSAVDSRRIGLIGLDAFSIMYPRDKATNPSPQRLPVDLRGSHTFYTYVTDGRLAIDFQKVDLNSAGGSDQLILRVRKASEPVSGTGTWKYLKTFPDDGVKTRTGRPGRPTNIQLSLEQLETGIYRVDIIASEDVIIRNLTTRQTHLTFAGQVYLASGPAYHLGSPFNALRIRVTGRKLAAWTRHREGLQTLRVGRKSLSLTEFKRNYEVALTGATTFAVAKGDVRLMNATSYTISPFRPLPNPLSVISLSSETDLEPYDYLLSPYVPVSKNTLAVDLLLATRELNLKNRKYQFALDGLGLANEKSRLFIDRIDVISERKPISLGTIWGRATKVKK